MIGLIKNKKISWCPQYNISSSMVSNNYEISKIGNSLWDTTQYYTTQ